MDDDTKRFLGYILGQVYRLQKRVDAAMCPASDAEIYALTHGFEGATEKILHEMGAVSVPEFTGAVDVLDPLFRFQEQVAALRGYTDLEPRFATNGVDRATVIRCLKYLLADGQFTEVIHRLDSEYSPAECRRFELWPTEK